MEDTEATGATATGATEATTTARGPLRLRLRLSPPPLLSPDMVTMDMAMDIALTDTGTLLPMPMDITVTMAKDLPMLSPDMVTMDVDMEDTMEVTAIMVTAMVMVMDTTVEKFQKFMLIQSD